MKKLFLLLFVTISFTARAWASDVVVAANEIPNFNPSGIGSDVQVIASVSNGTATVTSAGKFREGWIGLSGFRITINGVDYTVANVADADVQSALGGVARPTP